MPPRRTSICASTALRYARIAHPVGCLTLVITKRGLALVHLGNSLTVNLVEDCESPWISLFTKYLSGQPVQWSLPLDLDKATPFEKKVWEATREIPYGETRSYGWIAERIGSPGACRAVGGALGRNPIPIVIPCHRVVGVDGRLCGFSAGLEWKKKLLELEHNPVGCVKRRRLCDEADAPST